MRSGRPHGRGVSWWDRGTRGEGSDGNCKAVGAGVVFFTRTFGLTEWSNGIFISRVYMALLDDS